MLGGQTRTYWTLTIKIIKTFQFIDITHDIQAEYLPLCNSSYLMYQQFPVFTNYVTKGEIEMADCGPGGQGSGNCNDLMSIFAALTNRTSNKLIACYSVHI
jgi:hypothetical protein